MFPQSITFLFSTNLSNRYGCGVNASVISLMIILHDLKCLVSMTTLQGVFYPPVHKVSIFLFEVIDGRILILESG